MVSFQLIATSLTLFFCAAHSLAGQDFDCTDKEDGLYENPNECKTFYKCSGNNAYLYSCSVPLLFNPTLKVCDWPQDFQCTKSPSSDQSSENSGEDNTDEDFHCEGLPNGLYQNPTDCGTFYKCSNGFKYLYDCPSNLLFNPELLICDWPYNVPSCQTSDEPETEEPSTEEAPVEPENPETEKPSTEGSLDPKSEKPETEIPPSSATEEEGASTTELPEEFSCKELPSGLYPNPNDCGTFYKCSNGYAYLYDCPSNLLFNPELLVCDWPYNVPSCQEFDESTDKEETVTEDPATVEPETEAPATEEPETEAPATEEPETEASATEEPETEAPATEEPETEASASEEPETEAPATEEPETEAPATDEPETEAPATEEPETEASATEEPETEAPATEEPETEAPATEEPETEAPATEESETEAPATEEPETEAPIDPETEGPHTTGVENSSSSESPEEFSCQDLPSGLYANPNDCGTFYKCSNGYSYLYDCPSNLLFNPNLLVCDWPYNVPSCQDQETESSTDNDNEETQKPETESPAEPSTTEEPVEEEFSCLDRPSGLYPNPTDCQTFYKCSNGYKYLYNCPSILLFNPNLLVCDWPDNVPSCKSN